jgi:predicted dehydrogenase
MKRFRVAIFGLGNIGSAYDAHAPKRCTLSYARALSSHPGFELACGFDTDKARRDAFTKLHRVPAYGYSRLKERLADIDVVVIAVPIKYHYKVFKDVIRCSKPRMIVMEKPLASNLRDAHSIIKTVKRRKILFYVNYFRRIDPGINELRRSISLKRWGALKGITINYGDGLLNNGSHFVDLVTYLLGEPQRISVLCVTTADNPDFVFYYPRQIVVFKSSSGVGYNLKDIDLVFEKARITYTTVPETRLMLPHKTSCFGTKELVYIESGRLHLDLERFMANVAGHIYRMMLGRAEAVSSAATSLKTLETCFEVMKRGAAK